MDCNGKTEWYSIAKHHYNDVIGIDDVIGMVDDDILVLGILKTRMVEEHAQKQCER